jgi:hypothetical protein
MSRRSIEFPRPDRRASGARPWRDGRLALLVATVATLLAATPLSAQGPSPSAGPDATASDAPQIGPIDLEPGRHSWTELGTGFSLDFDEGWTVSPPLDGPIVTFERADMPGGVLTLTRFDGDTYADPCDPSSLTWVEPSAERIIEIIGGNPFLEADSPAPIELGGYSGRSVDVTTPPYTAEECRLALLLIWAIPMEEGEFVQLAGQAARFIALDIGRDVVVIAIETLPGAPFEPFAERSMELLRSLAFEPA